MSSHRHRRSVLGGLVSLSALVAVPPGAVDAVAAADDGADVVAVAPASASTAAPPVAPPANTVTLADPERTGMSAAETDRRSVSKSVTSHAAVTDPDLLGRTDATMLDVVVKLDYDAIATYAGDLPGLAATSPQLTGNRLTGLSTPEIDYTSHVERIEREVVETLAGSVPAATVVGAPLRTVYGGLRMLVPANRVGDVLAIPHVVAVHRNERRELLTDVSSGHIGADAVAPALGGELRAGAGALVAVLDSGLWPEHPMLVDPGGLPPRPTRPDGSPLPCNFGDNPLTPEVDPFECNGKVVAGEVFLDDYLRRDRHDPDEPFLDTARDGEGHGTHTATTAVGSRTDEAAVFGVRRGPLTGIAPGAALAVYKVCGAVGCFTADAVSAIEQAVRDGVDVINYSITGGDDPATDPVALAFLDAYAAGVFVSASVGNTGPEPGTAQHLAPWVTTVGATTLPRRFSSTLVVNGAGRTLRLDGASVTPGIEVATPIRTAADVVAYRDPKCLEPAPTGSLTGLIVVCARGDSVRAVKSFNVAQGGAVGMVLHNVDRGSLNADNHWLPTVHIDAGTELLELLAADPAATATFTAGAAAPQTPDVVPDFSARAAGGAVIKPDLMAPGVAILAGTSPAVRRPERGVPGQLWQVADGTSMAAPQVAGAAALLAARHPTWTPGQIKSALMTTAQTPLVDTDGSTPADPFAAGAGRIDVAQAIAPGLTFDVDPESMARLGGPGGDASVHLNLPSLSAPAVPGRIKTFRRATNVTERPLSYDVATTAPDGSDIIVSPGSFTAAPGETVELEVVIDSLAPTQQYFGEIRLVPRTDGVPVLHLPVAFVPQQGEVELTTSCTPPAIDVGDDTTCTVTAVNRSGAPVEVDLAARVTSKLRIVAVDGASGSSTTVRARNVTLPTGTGNRPTLAPGRLFGYLPMDDFVTPIPIGDEEIIQFDTPEFTYAGGVYDTIGVASNGYAVVGATTDDDVVCCPTAFPSPVRPNNVLAPFWSDLDGTDAEGIFTGVLTDNDGKFWFAVEWRVNVFGTDSERRFQLWIGLNGVEDVTFAYDEELLPQRPGQQPYTVGVEDSTGTEGVVLPSGVLPTADLRIQSEPTDRGGPYSLTLTVRGERRGTGVLAAWMTAPIVDGTTINRERVEVRPRR